MFDEKSRRVASLIAFGVCLYAAVMHLDVVIGALSAVINIFFRCCSALDSPSC